MDDGDPHDVDMESEGSGALDVYDDAHVIAYLQIREVPIGLTPKERDCVVHKAKRFKWEGNSNAPLSSLMDSTTSPKMKTTEGGVGARPWLAILRG
jgi:hypothetical protein